MTAALVLLLELATPQRNPILVLLYWQHCACVPARRATAGGAARGRSTGAFAVDARIVVVVARVLRRGLSLTKLLARQVALPEKGSKPRPRCSIM